MKARPMYDSKKAESAESGMLDCSMSPDANTSTSTSPERTKEFISVATNKKGPCPLPYILMRVTL